MSIKGIIALKGTDVTLVSVTDDVSTGYLVQTEEESDEKAVVQPLGAEELKYWQDAGIANASLICFISDESDAKLGDKVKIDGDEYLIRAIGTHGFAAIQGYKRVILANGG